MQQSGPKTAGGLAQRTPRTLPIRHPSLPLRPAKRALASRIQSLHGAHQQQQPHLARSGTDEHDKEATHFQFGHIFRIHSEDELKKMVVEYKDHTVVLMAKSSHCKPCKLFQGTYVGYAVRFADTVFLEIMGDENTTTRELMATWKIKVTPTFRLHRNGEFVQTLTGVNKSKLRDAILSGLAPSHRGRDWEEPEVDIDSDDSDSD